jgi:hypothetical protein
MANGGGLSLLRDRENARDRDLSAVSAQRTLSTGQLG